MKKIINKIILFLVVLFAFLSIASTSEAENLLDSSWELGGNSSVVSDYDLALATQSNLWWPMQPQNIVGRSVPFAQSGDGATISQRGAYCIGHGNTTISGGGYYYISNIYDIDVTGDKPGTITQYTEGNTVTYNYIDQKKAGQKILLQLAYQAWVARDQTTVPAYASPKTALSSLVFDYKTTLINDVGLYPEYNQMTYSVFGDTTDAVNYSNQVENYVFKDATEGTPKVRNINGTAYIGPYKVLTSGGSISGATVDGYTILGYSFSEGGSINTDFSQIQSGQAFYIVIQGNVSSKVTIKLTKQFQVAKARIMFLFSKYFSSQTQHLIMYKSELEWRNYSIPLKASEDPYTNLKLIKMDAGTGAALPNVQFRFKFNGQYYTTRGTFTSNVNDSTIFTTNGNGQIILNNIPVGNWTYEEVKNNNPGYENCEVIPPNGTVQNVTSYATMEGIERAKLVLRAIYQSQEGVNACAKLSNTDFVKVAYRCVLGREADSGGLSSWVNILNQGRNSTSEMKVLSGLYDSAEFTSYYKANDSWRTTFVTNMYKNLLGRTPNANSEVGYWVAILQGYFPITVYNDKTTEPLYLSKIDKDTKKGLANVGFRLQNTSSWQYVKDTNGTKSYVSSASSATVFYTDSKGNLKVTGLLPGKYRVYEVSNPNAGYLVEPSSYVDVWTNTASYQQIPNEYYFGNLVIEKYDQDTNQKLSNVEFRIRATSGEKSGQYVYLNSNGTVRIFKQ